MMKSNEFIGLDLKYYKEVLDNGLEIYLIPMENKKNYYMSYATRFGSEVVEFTKDGKTTKLIDGIAHFLEHKMFEQESGEDPFTYFSTSGTECNAMTDFTSTRYICYGTKNFKDNLDYLLKYVNSPYYTDKNVNKEKGIIAEELKMYNDIPDYRLEMRLRECIYKDSPRRIDIGGSVKSIQNITKEDLYLCYESFYNPSNMFVLIVGNFDLDEAMDTIKDNMDLIDKTSAVTINKKKEAKKVNILEDTLYGDINLEKIGIGLKIHNDLKDKLLTRLYYKMIFNCLLGSTSLFNERVEKLNLVHNFSFDIENYEDIYTLYIINSSNDIDKLLEEVKHEFKSHKIKESDFNRIKKVWIARLVKASDDVFEMIDISYDDIIRYGDIINNKIEIIKNMSYKEMKELLKKIDFDNMSVVRMKRKEN